MAILSSSQWGKFLHSPHIGPNLQKTHFFLVKNVPILIHEKKKSLKKRGIFFEWENLGFEGNLFLFFFQKNPGKKFFFFFQAGF